MKENEKAICLTQDFVKELVEKSGVTIVTIRNYLKEYITKGGLPLGIKIGGRWKIFPSRFEEFLIEGGVKKIT